jgi:hypothetical protein
MSPSVRDCNRYFPQDGCKGTRPDVWIRRCSSDPITRPQIANAVPCQNDTLEGYGKREDCERMFTGEREIGTGVHCPGDAGLLGP